MRRARLPTERTRRDPPRNRTGPASVILDAARRSAARSSVMRRFLRRSAKHSSAPEMLTALAVSNGSPESKELPKAMAPSPLVLQIRTDMQRILQPFAGPFSVKRDAAIRLAITNYLRSRLPLGSVPTDVIQAHARAAVTYEGPRIGIKLDAIVALLARETTPAPVHSAALLAPSSP